MQQSMFQKIHATGREAGLTLIELSMGTAIIVLIIAFAYDGLLRGMQLMAASDARKEASASLRRVGQLLEKEFAMASIDPTAMNQHVFSAAPILHIKYTHMDQGGVESSRMIVYDSVCASTLGSPLQGVDVGNYRPYSHLGCLPSNPCNWATETVAIRRRVYHSWSIGSSAPQETRCFPDSLLPDANGNCVARPGLNDRRRQTQGMSLCASAPASHRGEKAYVSLSSYFIHESQTMTATKRDLALVRTHGHTEMSYIEAP